MPLPLVPTQDGDERRHRLVTASTLNEVIKACYPREGSWTATFSGSGTAGTYEIASQTCRYTRIGRRVWLELNVATDASVTGGGTGNLQITGVPYPAISDSIPCGAMRTSVNFGASWCVLQFSASDVLTVVQVQDDAVGTFLPISAITASKDIRGSISYETDAP